MKKKKNVKSKVSPTIMKTFIIVLTTACIGLSFGKPKRIVFTHTTVAETDKLEIEY